MPYVERVRRARAGATGPARILDVGCGDGTNLSLFRRAFGGDVETHGIEMSERAAAIARAAGHAVVASCIEDASLPAASFDLVYSFHVVEHVEDPPGFLRAMREALRPDGWMLVDTPNVDTIDFRLFGRSGHWGAYHVPRHFTLYDERTFAAAAERAGLEVVETTYQPSAVHWVWTLHSMLAPKAPRLADRMFPPVDIFLKGTPWNAALLAAFTTVDLAIIAATRRSSNLRVLLRRR
jgi:2-polyprenyl-3-methyl-5-hydroxy-6-metoxy-1,4-benzoquinol methylase